MLNRRRKPFRSIGASIVDSIVFVITLQWLEDVML